MSSIIFGKKYLNLKIGSLFFKYEGFNIVFNYSFTTDSRKETIWFNTTL